MSVRGHGEELVKRATPQLSSVTMIMISPKASLTITWGVIAITSPTKLSIVICQMLLTTKLSIVICKMLLTTKLSLLICFRRKKRR